MKQIILLFIFSFFISLQSFSQLPNWTWAKSAGDSANDIGNSISVDANGNVFVTGCFQNDSIHFGNIVLYNGPRDSISPDSIFTHNNMFIVKYDSTGNVLWAKSAGGKFDDIGNSIATDNFGSVYVIGTFTHDSIVFGNIVLPNNGSTNAFIVKYDSSGNVLWAKCSSGGHRYCNGNSIAADAFGNIYVTGEFSATAPNFVTFDTIVFPCTSVYSNENMFIAKYDSTGKIIWAKCVAGNLYVGGYHIKTDLYGNVYAAGQYRGYGTAATINFDSTVLAWTGMEDVFLAKYDSSGNLIWVKGEGGIYLDYLRGITTDVNGNVYVTGPYNSPSITIGNTTITNLSGNCGRSGGICEDIFIIKYDSSGNSIWAKSIGETANDWPTGITTDASGNVFITGFFQWNSVMFGSIVLNNPGGFVVKYDSSGNVPWAFSIPGIIGNSIAYDFNGSLLVTGNIYGDSVYFGNSTLINANASCYDVFTAKLTSLNNIVYTSILVDKNACIIFPNPAQNNFIINNISPNENTLLRILNPAGQIIYAEKLFGKTKHEVSSYFAKGIYFVQLSSKDLNIVRKLIVE